MIIDDSEGIHVIKGLHDEQGSDLENNRRSICNQDSIAMRSEMRDSCRLIVSLS